MPAHQYEASLYATPPSGGVRFVFLRYTHGFRSLCSLNPWLLYAASPCGEPPEFRLPVGRLGKIRSPRQGGERTQAGASEQRERPVSA